MKTEPGADLTQDVPVSAEFLQIPVHYNYKYGFQSCVRSRLTAFQVPAKPLRQVHWRFEKRNQHSETTYCRWVLVHRKGRPYCTFPTEATTAA
jgi:hypothetical protein